MRGREHGFKAALSPSLASRWEKQGMKGAAFAVRKTEKGKKGEERARERRSFPFFSPPPLSSQLSPAALEIFHLIQRDKSQRERGGEGKGWMEEGGREQKHWTKKKVFLPSFLPSFHPLPFLRIKIEWAATNPQKRETKKKEDEERG